MTPSILNVNSVVTMSSLEMVAAGTATNEQAAAVANAVIHGLMRPIMTARHTQVTDRESYDNAWNAMQTTRSLARHAVILLKRYPELATSIEDSLAVTAYAEALVLGVLNERFVNSSARAATNCKTYIVKNPASGLIKIGKSISPESRIKGLETGAGAALETLAILSGDRERELHLTFSDLRVFGEWFSDDGSISTFLADEVSK